MRETCALVYAQNTFRQAKRIFEQQAVSMPYVFQHMGQTAADRLKSIV